MVKKKKPSRKKCGVQTYFNKRYLHLQALVLGARSPGVRWRSTLRIHGGCSNARAM